MKRIILTFAFASVVIISFSQTFEWLRPVEVDYNYNPEMINYSIATDAQENSYLFGTKEHIEFYIGSYGQLFIQKYDTDGNQLWMNIIHGLGMTKGSVCDAYGNLYIIGNHRSNLNFWDDDSLLYSGNAINSFFAKVLADGSLAWAINMNNLYPETSDINDIVADENGNILLGISSWPDSYVTKFSPDGTIISEIMQTTAGFLSGIDIDESGNIVTTGSCSGTESLFGGVNYITPFGYSMYLAYYDTDGYPLWVEFAEDVTCIFPKVKFDALGNIFWTGSLNIAATFGSIQSGGPNWVYDFFLTKVSPTGNFEWVFEVPEIITGDALSGKITPLDFTSEGNVVIGGFTRGSIDWGNNVVSAADNYYDLLTMEINSQGEAVWVKTAGGNFYDNVHGLAVSDLGNIFIAGISGDTVNFDTITYQSDQFFYPFIAKIDNDNITDIENPGPAQQTLSIYPNPAIDFIYLDQEGLSTVRIYNSTGLLVLEVRLGHGQRQINVSDLSAGIFFVSALTENNSIYQGRFIKR